MMGVFFLCGVLPIWSYYEVEVVEFGAAEMRIRPKLKGGHCNGVSDSRRTRRPFNQQVSPQHLLKIGAPSKDLTLGA